MRTKQKFKWDKLTVGVCYYPEQWNEDMWESDLLRMKDSGISCIRIGEFAWSIVEKTEGVFCFDLFDRFLEKACKVGMNVIIGTPTATPPAWLTNKYPEVLNCRQDGTLYRHGMRRHYNYNSPVYKELCKRIVDKYASHFAAHPCVVGWQIDNEINCETSDFYSESDCVAFRQFLKAKYGNLDRLNSAWGTVFWSQTYTDWEEIFVPRVTVHNSTNPHLMLDYIRFVSDSAVKFCKMQSDILRKYVKKGDFITTNGIFSHLDSHRMTDEALDVFTYDSYPNFAFTLDSDPENNKYLNDRRWSDHLTEVRAVCPHFGIMEQQSGAMGWNTRMESPAPKPGQMKLWAMQSVAHGADLVSFFRWRTSVMGTEMYWHGILDYDSKDNRKLGELRSFASSVQKIAACVGSSYKAYFGVLRDYDNIWDADVDRWHKRLTDTSEKEIFAASQLSHTPMDYVYLLDSTDAAELSKYPVLIYPHPLILTKQRADLLEKYVRSGGILVVGARCGQKDESGKCVMMSMPGLLSELTGTIVCDYTFVGPADDAVSMDFMGSVIPAGIFNDVLSPSGDSAVLARYKGNYYDGEPGMTLNNVGAGKVIHFGGTFSRESVCEILRYLGIIDPLGDIITVGEECEVCVREKDGERWLFVLNYSPKTVNADLHVPMTDADDGKVKKGTVALSPYECKVFI